MYTDYNVYIVDAYTAWTLGTMISLLLKIHV